MNWRYGWAFLLLGLCVPAACGLENPWSIAAAIVLTPASLLLSAAYLTGNSSLLGKLPNGRISLVYGIMTWPYLSMNILLLWWYARAGRAQPYAEILPNLFLGRRLFAHEAANSPWTAVLDLTAEFPEPRGLCVGRTYRSMPVLDATAPTREQLIEAVSWIREQRSLGPVYVHCALGHGRSASVIIAYLISEGLAGSVSDALNIVQSRRPGVGLNACQIRRLSELDP